MIVKTIPAGALQANCYIIIDEETNEGAILDPGGDSSHIISVVESLGVKIKYILLTHAHADHNGGVVDIKNKYDVEVLMNKEEEEYMEKDKFVFGKLPKIYGFINDGDILKLGNLIIKCIHTPGHTKGGMCFLIEDKVFTGDTLFQGSIGRIDFPGGNFDEIIKSIEEKLMVLESNVEVYPGHGPKSTIIFERMRNPFLA
ncbi:MBL fold metallo-hydrolase [Clostridium carnis]